MKLLLGLVFGLITITTLSFAQDKQNLKIYPAPQEGFQRAVIILSPKKNEEDYKVEIIAGKTMKVDCNIHNLMGKFEEKDLKGWGYTYFVYNSDGKMTSTMRGCPDNVLKDKFVFNTQLTRYNSKLPIVVYAPKGFQVKYKIWTRSQKQLDAVVR